MCLAGKPVKLAAGATEVVIPKHLQRYVTGPATIYCAGKVPRMIRFRAYRKKTYMGPILTQWGPMAIVWAMMATYVYKRVFYDYWVTEQRNFWFFTTGIKGNQSVYERAMWEQKPQFPETAEEYEAPCASPGALRCSPRHLAVLVGLPSHARHVELVM